MGTRERRVLNFLPGESASYWKNSAALLQEFRSREWKFL